MNEPDRIADQGPQSYSTEWKVDDFVWAQMGNYGWRTAVVVMIGKTWIHLKFEPKGNGRRKPSELRRRDPLLKGKDKPRPPWKRGP